MMDDFEQQAQQAKAIVALPPDLAILRLENETIQSLAAARPRNHASIKADLVAQLDAYPSFARAAIYAKPVGADPETGRQKIARGLSIRAAEALAEAYGFCRIRSEVTPIDEDTVKVEASFTDYQKGRIWQDAGIVSKWYRSSKKAGSKMMKHADDRFYGVVVKAEVSRRIREVITRSVPPGLRAELQEMAERRLAGLLDEKAITTIVAYFGKLGVSLAQLEEHVGRTTGSGWTEENRLDLHGLANAIKDGETTLADVFGEREKLAPAAGPVKGSDLSQPVATRAEVSVPPVADEARVRAAIQADAQREAIRQDFAKQAAAPKPSREPGEDDPFDGDPLPQFVIDLGKCKLKTEVNRVIAKTFPPENTYGQGTLAKAKEYTEAAMKRISSGRGSESNLFPKSQQAGV